MGSPYESGSGFRFRFRHPRHEFGHQIDEFGDRTPHEFGHPIHDQADLDRLVVNKELSPYVSGLGFGDLGLRFCVDGEECRVVKVVESSLKGLGVRAYTLTLGFRGLGFYHEGVLDLEELLTFGRCQLSVVNLVLSTESGQLSVIN